MPVDPLPGPSHNTAQPSYYQLLVFRSMHGHVASSAADMEAASRYPSDQNGALDYLHAHARQVKYKPPIDLSGTKYAKTGLWSTPRAGGSGGGGSGGSGGDLMSLIEQAGFKGEAAKIMYGIVLAESGGNAQAHNGNSSTGDNSYGLAQINMLGSMGPERLREFGLNSNNDLYDPLTNLKVAYRLSNGGKNFSPWTTYTSGAYRSHMADGGASVTNGGSGGSGGGGDSATGGNPTMADYQGVDSLGNLLTKVPALRHLVDQAVQNNWTTDKFQNEVENSPWYRQHSATARSVLIQQANDPATYRQTLGNTKNSITELAKQLGFRLTGTELDAIANSALLTGNDTNQSWLQQEIGRKQNYSTTTNLGSLGGQMATVANQLSEQAANYGMNWTSAQIAQRAQQVVEGNTSAENYTLQLKNWAKSAFPALAKDIDAGQTVKQLADPYMQSMSQLLEVDPGTLNLYTPLIRRALQGTQDPKTKDRVATNLSDFEDQVRNDPRWQYTQNAKDTMSTALLKIGSDFGFGM